MRATKIILPMTLLVAAVLFADDRPALPTADEIGAKVAAVFDGIKTFEQETTTEGTNALGQSFVAHTRLVIERSQKDGKTVEKSFSVYKLTLKKADGTEEVSEYKTVVDGAYEWNESRSMGYSQSRVEKTDAPAPDSYRSAENLAKEARHTWQQCHFKITGEETIGAQKMYVLEGSWVYIGGYDRHGTTKLWVGEDDLFVHRARHTVVIDQMPNTHPAARTEDVTTAKVNQPIDEKLFVYTPPEGAKITDNTAAGKAKP